MIVRTKALNNENNYYTSLDQLLVSRHLTGYYLGPYLNQILMNIRFERFDDEIRDLIAIYMAIISFKSTFIEQGSTSRNIHVCNAR